MSLIHNRQIPTTGCVFHLDPGNSRSISEFRTPNSATGGVITERVISGETYVQHVFTTAGSVATFTPNQLMEVDYLVVGGGGGGGGIIGGGGGGGGVLYGTKYVFGPQDVYVGLGGRGGAGWNSFNQAGERGQNSYFGEKIAYGGGGGAAFGGNGVSPWFGTTISSPVNGGSGGGATVSISAGTGVSGQGNGGGSGADNDRGAGGGGAGGTGLAPTTGAGGVGGAGISYASLFGTSVGVSGLFGGGGGGGARGGITGLTAGGAGGTGGGGAGSINTTRATDGTANTGGGGGAAGYNGDGYYQLGGNGGSGVVVVRYKKYPQIKSISGQLAFNYNASVAGAPTYSSSNGGTLTFNGTSDYLFLPGSSIILGSQTYTYLAWIYVTDFGTGSDVNMIFSKWGNASGTVINTSLATTSGQKLRALVCNGVTAQSVVSTANLPLNGWVHVGVSFLAPNLQIWINGASAGVTNTGYSTISTGSTTNFHIGKFDFDWVGYRDEFKGSMGVMTGYTRALSAAEVSAHFQATRSRYGV